MFMDNRLSKGLLGLVFTAAIAFTGCSSTGPKDVNGPVADEAGTGEKSRDKVTVDYINVVGEGDRVLIGTTGAVRYTVFKLTDPPRLIVDMPGVDLEKVSSTVSVGNDYLNEINAVSYGDDKGIGRVVIGLKDGIEYDVKAGENSILVSLKKNVFISGFSQDGTVAKAIAEAEQPAAEAAEKTEAAVKESAPKSEAVEKKAEPAAVKASEAKSGPTRIVKIESSTEGENTVVKIFVEGNIGNYNSFELDAPSRIVIDVWGVENSTGRDAIKLKDKYLKLVRIGSHPDKSRLVFDSSKKSLPSHAIKKEGDAIVLTLGPGVPKSASISKEPVKESGKHEVVKVAAVEPAVAEPENTAPVEAAVTKEAPVEAAPVAASEPAPAAAEDNGIKVQKIDFRKDAGKGALTIVNSAEAEYTVNESKDGKSVLINIKGATIPDELKRTLDATKLNTPVVSISSYQESVKPLEVRVLVKLKDKAPFEVVADKGSIRLEFSEPVAVSAEEKATDVEKIDLLTSKEKPAGKASREYTGRKIDLDMMDANISDVLRLLAEVSNLNIIASDEVKGTISLRLKNVPWDQAFDIILKSKDLDMIKEGNVVRVAPAAKVRQEREAALASGRAQEKLEELELLFVPINYATSADLVAQVKTVLTERGTVTSEARTNTLIIRDIRKGREAAVDLVKKLDTSIPQVLIEARIVEASSSFARDLGIQWGADFQSGGNVNTSTFGSTTTTGQSLDATTTSPTFTARTGAQNFAVNMPASGTAGTLGALGFIIGKAGQNPLVIDLRLSAGESEGRLKTISRPRVTTLDNKEAKIEQGESIPFETTSAAGTATTFIDANLSLTVTPHITPDGSVLMKIKASRNSIGTFRTSAGQPSINKKEAITEVLVKDGETTVIGGIVISDKNDTERGIPFLKDIPLLGWIFKSRSVSDSQTELLIFLTPTIMKEKIVG